jgi:serine/threonine protein kinase/Tfp pilus assembly protein PilF
MNCPRCHFENPTGTRFCGNCASPLPQGTDIGPTETIQVPIKELAAGTTFARRYQIIEDLGKGGMGRVYKVFDTEVREKMALKLLNPDIAADERTIERFRNELKLARAISHRNICRMFDLGREEGTYYITMEYVPGEDLKSLIHRIGALPLGKAVSIARQVSEGLSEAHRLGVVHRDLKPQNVMIDREGNARIMDFGIARSLEAKGITGAGVMIGTPEYMAPEQVDGKDADQRSDIYSLGIILFEMLTGRLPFEGDTPLSVAVKQKSEKPPDPKSLNAQIPEDLGRIILRCLEKPKEKRFQSADEVQTALARIEKGLPATSQPLPIRKTLTSKQITVQFSLKKALWPVAALIAVAIIGFAVWKIIPHKAGPKRAVAVIGFTNRTGDQNLDYLQEAIPNLLITSLEQSGHFQVTSWERLKDLLRQAGRDPSAMSDEEAGFEVCRKSGIDALVLGSYIKAGETFATDVKVLDVASKQILRTASSKGDGVSSVLKTQIDEISRTISRGLGPARAKIEISPPKIADLTTNSIEAYNYFLRGRDEYEKFHYTDARRFLEKAVSLDPTFAVAYLYLGQAIGQLLDPKAQAEAYEKAKTYSNRASEKERLYIESYYAGAVERNPEKKLRLLLELTKKYPQEKDAHFELGFFYQGRGDNAAAAEECEKALALDPNFGYAMNQAAYIYAEMGDVEKAIQYFQRYAAINPGEPNPIDSIAELNFRLGKFDEAKAKYLEALEVRPDFISSCRGLAYISAYREDYAAATHWLDEFVARAPTPTAKMEKYWLEAYLDYFLGRWNESLAEYLALKEQAEKSGSPYLAATVDWITGFLYGDMGRYDLALKAFQANSDYNFKRNPSELASNKATASFYLGWIEAKQGRLESAKARLREVESLLSELDSASREYDAFRFQLLKTEVFLAENSLDSAIEAGEKLVPENFPDMNTASIATYNIPFLKDVLARAYWKKGDLDKAIAEYVRLTAIEPDSQVRYWIHPLYHYRLGRAYEDKGEKTKAAAEYQKFLEYWKDADANHPELADAKKRLDALIS